MKKRMQSMVLTFIAAVAITLMPFATQAASPFACRSVSRVGAQSIEGPLTLTCSACSPALNVSGVASGSNAITIPQGSVIKLGTNLAAISNAGDYVTTNMLQCDGNARFNGTLLNNGAFNGGSLAFNDPTRWLSTTTALLESSTTNTATDTAFTLTTLPTNTLVAGDKLLSLQNATVEKFRVDYDGSVVSQGQVVAGSFTGNTHQTGGGSTAPLVLRAYRANDATAVVAQIGNTNALTTPGAKILSLYSDNMTTERAFFNHLGALTTPSVNFSASRWDDIRVPLITAKPGATKVPGFDKFKDSGSGSTGVFAYHFDAAAIEEVFFSVQLPHGYKEGSAIKPHVHWTPTTSGAAQGNVVFDLECTRQPIDGEFGNTTIITTTATAGDTGYVHRIADFTDISGSGLGISSILICRIARVGDDAADTYAADAAVLEVDFHYEIDTVGSASATAK